MTTGGGGGRGGGRGGAVVRASGQRLNFQVYARPSAELWNLHLRRVVCLPSRDSAVVGGGEGWLGPPLSRWNVRVVWKFNNSRVLVVTFAFYYFIGSCRFKFLLITRKHEQCSKTNVSNSAWQIVQCAIYWICFNNSRNVSVFEQFSRFYFESDPSPFIFESRYL